MGFWRGTGAWSGEMVEGLPAWGGVTGDPRGAAAEGAGRPGRHASFRCASAKSTKAHRDLLTHV